MPVSKGLIKRVAAGKDPIASLFAEQQLLFLLSMANKKIDYAKVVVMGPMRSLAVEVRRPGVAVAAYRRALAARGWGPIVRGVDQGPGGSGRGCDRRIHGVSCRGRGRAR